VDIEDVAACYRAVESRDRRFDGMFYTAVRSTGIYCRPSCPARTPLPGNVSFHRTAAAAQAAGYRACKRCLPDAAPGSPAWDLTADTVGRAMRLIADGVVEREGVEGLARRLGYTARHLSRLLTAELGAGPLALARAQRAQNARLLLERTDWRLADVAFAAGFASVRQFNDTVREVYATTPTDLRSRRRSGGPAGGTARLDVRLPVRTPFDARSLWRFLDAHLVPGVEAAGDGWYARTLRLPHGPGTLRLELGDPSGTRGGVWQVPCTLRVSDLRDVSAAIERCRRLLDADCDPLAVDDALGADPALRPLVVAHPGLRVPGHVDGSELALRTVLGQQVSVAAGNRLAAVLADRCAEPLPETLRGPGLERLFPSADQVAALDPGELPMPRARGEALVGLAAALAAGEVALDRSADRSETRARLLALRGIGPWSADYVVMRALGDPDVFLPTDVAVRRALRELGLRDPVASSGGWRPWRSYALMHLWTRAAWDTHRAERKEP
jgi:AraC family transcriptional regulator, regulatory protein of adaptative response / DNA-3-methyladenine glycosylase II